jgi:hopene-associated glycosyltransferase HpnB
VTAAQAAAWLALAIWIYLLAARGGFWRMRESVPAPPAAAPLPRVVAVIPARNEELVVADAVASLAAQDYAGEFHIVLVDDHSSDCTAARARQAAGAQRLTVIQAAPLPQNWAGKLWAVSQGVAEAAKRDPDYLLLCDADIAHPPGNVTALVARAEAGGFALVSYMATLRARSFAERALMPAFVFFFFLLYPPRWIADPRRRTAGAAGGCMLVRRAALEKAGGIAAIRGAVIDDCALAAAVKRAGGTVWLGLSAQTLSLRGYGGFAAIGRMISRSAFTQLRHSWLLLAGTLAGLALTYLAPPVTALRAEPAGAAAWLLMTLAYIPVLRFYRRSLLWAPALPLVACFYAGSTLYSALCWRFGRGGEWKGRRVR